MITTSRALSRFDVGYIFFTHAHDGVAEGIDFFERWARMEAPKQLSLAVHHTGIVVSPTTVVEAQVQAGVVERPISDYFISPTTTIAFRRPRGWTLSMGMDIAIDARSRIGCKYRMPLICAQLAANSFLGHFLNKLTGNAPDRWVSQFLDKDDEFICSKLSAWCLARRPELARRGILREPLNTISPQELFVDQEAFEL